MKAMRIVGWEKPLQMAELSAPKVGDVDVLVKVKTCGVCHSDIHLADGYYNLAKEERIRVEDRGIRLPLTPGHEVAGIVEKTGSNVVGINENDEVLVYPWIGCGVCKACKTGYDNLCIKPRSIGVYSDGGYAEYLHVPHYRFLIKLDGLNIEDAAPLSCSGLTAYSALKKANLSCDETLVIEGVGGLGNMAIQLAENITGATVVAVDMDNSKLPFAKKLGAEYALNPLEVDVLSEVKSITDGRGADAVIDFVGNSRTAELAFQLLSKGGRMVCVGLFGGVLNLPLPFMPLRALEIVGNYTGTIGDLIELLSLARRGVVKTVISRSFKLEEANEALEKLREGKIEGRATLRI